MTFQIKSIHVITALMLVAGTALFTSCTNHDLYYSYQGQLVNEHEDITWKVQEEPHSFIEVREDLNAGINAELARQREERAGAGVKSVKLASALIVSEDLSDFSYLDELELYLVAANPEDRAEQPAEPRGVLIATLNKDQTSQSYLNLQMTNNELWEELQNDHYDLYFVGKANGQINQMVYDDIVDVELTFQIDISH